MSASQTLQWPVDRSLSDADKSDVLALASKLAIEKPALIRFEIIGFGCKAIRLESAPVSTANRRTWRRAWVTNTAWRGGCGSLQPDTPQVGLWVAAGDVEEIGAWRVPLRDSFIEVETSPTIQYFKAAAIVEAVRTGRLINRLPPGGLQIPIVDAESIRSIWPDHQDPALYRVWLRASNVVMVLAVRGTAVELRYWAREYA